MSALPGPFSLRVWLGLVVLVGAASCVSGNYADTEFRCGDGQTCPAGYSCIDLICIADDGALPPDDDGSTDDTGGVPSDDTTTDDTTGGTPPGDPEPPFAPSNISDDLVSAGTASLVLEGAGVEVIIDTDSGAIVDKNSGANLRPAGVTFSVVSQPGTAPDLGVFSATDVRFGSGVEIRVVGAAALVLAASGVVDIDCDVDARGGYLGDANAGPGGYDGGTLMAPDGLGPGGGKGTGAAELGADVGGGGAGHLAAGGPGGAAAGGQGFGGGTPYGAPALVPLVGGSGGGAGGDRDADSDAGVGGGGGGAIQITAWGSVLIGSNATLNVGGGGGDGGDEDDAGGGGGSGGAVLIEAPSIVLQGRVAANGGGGGAGADLNNNGADGKSGRSTTDRATGGDRVGEGAGGGRGGAGDSPAGAAGDDALLGDNVLDNAGGGGGGAGRIRLRSPALVVEEARLSPAAGVTTDRF